MHSVIRTSIKTSKVFVCDLFSVRHPSSENFIEMSFIEWIKKMIVMFPCRRMVKRTYFERSLSRHSILNLYDTYSYSHQSRDENSILKVANAQLGVRILHSQELCDLESHSILLQPLIERGMKIESKNASFDYF